MPVVINEVEVLPERQPSGEASASSAERGQPAEPAYEQLRRLHRDLAGRDARRRAD